MRSLLLVGAVLATAAPAAADPSTTITGPVNNANLTANVDFYVTTQQTVYQGASYLVVQVYDTSSFPEEVWWGTYEQSYARLSTLGPVPGLPAGSYTIVVTYYDLLTDNYIDSDSVTVTVGP